MADYLNKEAMPQRENILIWRGDYTEITFDFTDDEGLPVSLVGYTGKADIVQLGNVIGTFEFDIVDGEVKLFLESPAAASLPAGVYDYDFQLKQDATGRVRTFLYGQVVVREQVTVG